MDVSFTLQKFIPELSVSERERVKKELSAYLNELLQHNFSTLVLLLYRADISEQKLKTVLKENKNVDAGDLIARLLIEREAEKITARKSTQLSNQPSDDEAW